MEYFFQNNGCVTVPKIKDISGHENITLCVKHLKTFLMESKICNMTCMSGVFDKSVFDGNTILSKIIEEKREHRYVYVGGDMTISFRTNDKNYKYISIMGNILTPYSIAVGHDNIYFLTPHFEFIKREKIDDN